MKTAVWIIFALIFLLMPIIGGTKIYYNGDTGKLYFGVYLYDKIRIFKGEVNFTKKRVVIRIGKKRFSYPYKKVFDDRKKLDIFSGFEITSIIGFLEIGSEKNKLEPLALAGAYSTAGSIVLSVIKQKNKMLDAYSCVFVHENMDILKYNFSINIAFNLLLLIWAGIKKLVEKIINGKRDK